MLMTLSSMLFGHQRAAVPALGARTALLYRQLGPPVAVTCQLRQSDGTDLPELNRKYLRSGISTDYDLHRWRRSKYEPRWLSGTRHPLGRPRWRFTPDAIQDSSKMERSRTGALRDIRRLMSHLPDLHMEYYGILRLSIGLSHPTDGVVYHSNRAIDVPLHWQGV